MIRGTWKISGQTLIDSKRFENKFNRTVQGLAVTVARDMQPVIREEFKSPGQVHYPIQWTSDKQRKAFFATRGFGRGIPTKRTGASDSAWMYVYEAGNGGEGTFILRNSVSYTKFVRGSFRPGDNFQQQFHKNTGYESTLTVKARINAKARIILVARFKETLGSFGSLTI